MINFKIIYSVVEKSLEEMIRYFLYIYIYISFLGKICIGKICGVRDEYL